MFAIGKGTPKEKFRHCVKKIIFEHRKVSVLQKIRSLNCKCIKIMNGKF